MNIFFEDPVLILISIGKGGVQPWRKKLKIASSWCLERDVILWQNILKDWGNKKDNHTKND